MNPRTVGIAIIFALVAIGLFIYVYRTPAQVERIGWATGTFGGVSLSLELATTTAAQELGLGGRTSLPTDYGMLFVFPQDGEYGFWMKDTLIPLDMFWLNDQGQVVWMEQDVATDTYSTAFYPESPARYVLETSAGFAEVHDIATGTPLVVSPRLQNLQ
jgi:uncharacterized membrane protein (UPF0127 family)